MKFDFYQDSEYWISLIKEFIEVITGFFGDLGIKIFKDAE